METRTGETVKALLWRRLCNPRVVLKSLLDSSDSNYSKLKHIMYSSIKETCNNSVLLLGPRACGKNTVLELVLEDLSYEYADSIYVVRLNGLLHFDDSCALKEIARQLCVGHQLSFSKMASFDDNSQFMITMLRECGLSHRTIIFSLREFDLFARGKQKFLYSLFDALQSVTSQAVVIGISCRMDADQLLEKRVRSRFSHRKLLFFPPSKGDTMSLIENILTLPTDATVSVEYCSLFNQRLQNIFADERFEKIISAYLGIDSSFNHLLRFLFISISCIDMDTGFLSVDNFQTAFTSIGRQPKHDSIKDCSILELYLLVCIKRLETKGQSSYNFNSVFKEYRDIHNLYQTSDQHGRDTCLRAFERLVQRELVYLVDHRAGLSPEFRPVKLLISHVELLEGLKAYTSCPVVLHKLMDR